MRLVISKRVNLSLPRLFLSSSVLLLISVTRSVSPILWNI